MGRKCFASALLLGGASLLMSPAALGQLVTMTDRDVYQLGQPIVVQFKLTNATMAPAQYTTDNGATEVHYILKRIDVDDPVTPTTFQATLNGEPVEVRQLDFWNGIGAVVGGTIGPGKSSSLGGSLGFGMPFNFLQGYRPTYGSTFLLTNGANQSTEILEGDRMELRTPGVYRLTTLIGDLWINGYRYSASTGYLADERLLRVTPRIPHPLEPSAP